MLRLTTVVLIAHAISSVSSQLQERHHICEGEKMEAAGLSGTVKVTGNCQLNLTEITGRISILRVKPCVEAPQLTINDALYCHEADSTDSYINVTEDKIVIIAGEVEHFDMEYYHGKQGSLID